MILNTNEPAQIQTGESLIESSNCEKLFVVKIDSKLSFEQHIKIVCKKASNLRGLARVTPYMAIKKKKVLMNSFLDSQFNYCLLVWSVIVVGIIQRLIIFMKDALVTTNHLMRNFYEKMDQFLFTTGIFKHLQRKCIK